jgi:hypothetical protein
METLLYILNFSNKKQYLINNSYINLYESDQFQNRLLLNNYTGGASADPGGRYKAEIDFPFTPRTVELSDIINKYNCIYDGQYEKEETIPNLIKELKK